MDITLIIILFSDLKIVISSIFTLEGEPGRVSSNLTTVIL